MIFRPILDLMSGRKRETPVQVRSDSITSRKALPLPFHMDCDDSRYALYPLSDGRFHLLYDCPIAPLLIGPDYVLAENPLANFLAARALDKVDFLPATIYRGSTGEEYRTHQQIIVGEQFRFKDLHDIALDGERLFLLDRAMFVSPALKQVLVDSPFTYLQFSEGLDDFCFGT